MQYTTSCLHVYSNANPHHSSSFSSTCSSPRPRTPPSSYILAFQRRLNSGVSVLNVMVNEASQVMSWEYDL
jgi:hypothetical protein